MGNKGVDSEVLGIGVSDVTDKDVDAWSCLAAWSLAHYASIACLWVKSVGTAELKALRSLLDAVSNRLGQGAVIPGPCHCTVRVQFYSFG